MMQLTNKRSSKILANYTIEGTVLENVESIKFLGVTITNDLKWNTHISNYVFETGSMTGILGQLKWESLKKRRNLNLPDTSYTSKRVLLGVRVEMAKTKIERKKYKEEKTFKKITI